MSDNTECITGDHHAIEILAYNVEQTPAREQSVYVRCAECGASATAYLYSEDLSWKGVPNE